MRTYHFKIDFNLFNFVISCMLGYLVGLWMHPELFNPDLHLTNWSNIWTYVWIVFWPFMLLGHFVFLLFSVPFVLVLCAVFVIFVFYIIVIAAS